MQLAEPLRIGDKELCAGLIETCCVSAQPAIHARDVAFLQVAQDRQLLRFPFRIVLVELADAGDLIRMQLPVIQILINRVLKNSASLAAFSPVRKIKLQ